MSSGYSYDLVATPKTTGVGFGSTVTQTFGSPAQGGPSAASTFSSLAQSSLAFGTSPQQQQPQQHASGITFGTPVSQPTALTFATPTASNTTQIGLPFVTPTSTSQTGLQFLTPTTSASPFGSATPSFGQTNLNFGAAATTTVAGAQPQTGGFAFGAPAAAATGFGTPAPSSSFAAPVTSASFGTPVTSTAFGTPATSTTFGAPLPSTTFGTPTSSTFGTPTSSTFGTPTSSTFGAPVASTTFGTPATSSTFGGTVTSATFGASATPTFGPGSATATTTAFGVSATPQFGVAATTTAFGAPVTSTVAGQTLATTTAPSLGFGLNFGTPNTTATTTPLSFGLGTTTSTTKPIGLFSSTPAVAAATVAAAATTTGLGFGLAPITTQTTGFGVGSSTGMFGMGGKTFGSLGSSAVAATTTTTTTTTSVGLGGLDPSQNKLGLAGTGSSRTDNKAVKENQVPNAIVQTVDSFKNFLKTQKNLISDIARGSAKPLNKVQEETENLKQNLASLQNGIQRSSALVVKLKSDTAKCLQNAEMAQRTHETPPGLQYDNTAPLKYFQDLVANFEHEMKVFKLEINNTEKHLHSLMQPMPLTSQELSLAMRRLHDSFVALAGRLQSVHNSVETEKNQYLLLRKYFLKDSSNVFEEEAKKSVLASSKTKSISKASAGPTPFSALGGQHGFGLLSSSTTLSKPSLSSGWSGGQTPQPQLQQPLQQQAPTQFQQSQFSTPTLSNTLFSGANTSSLTSPQPVENQSFQLQKPPLGNKRGKR